jgi:polyene glycosyltransferase
MERIKEQDASILFVCTQHAGQINSLLTIIEELSRRMAPGLFFASTDNQRKGIENAAVGSDISYLSCGASDTTQKLFETTLVDGIPVYDGPLSTSGSVRTLKWLLDEDRLMAEYRCVLTHIDRVNPQLMVIDISTIGAIDAAMTRRIPFILSVPCTPSAPYGTSLPWGYPLLGSGLPLQMTFTQKLSNLWYRIRLMVAMVTGFPWLPFGIRRKAAGIVNLFADTKKYCDTANAIFCYSIFGLEYPFKVPQHLHMLGAMISEKPASNDPILQWLDEHPSTLFVGLGTLAQLSKTQIHMLVDVFKRLTPEHSILWKLPKDQQALLPVDESLPPNIRIEHWIPSQLDVLAHPNVRVFVSHGGGNGFHEGIYFGKPLLVMPFWFDCFDFAVRAVDSGVGLAIDCPPQFSANEVLTKLRRLLTERHFSERARYWGEQLRHAGGPEKAVDLILTMLPNVRLVLEG